MSRFYGSVCIYKIIRFVQNMFTMMFSIQHVGDSNNTVVILYVTESVWKLFFLCTSTMCNQVLHYCRCPT